MEWARRPVPRTQVDTNHAAFIVNVAAAIDDRSTVQHHRSSRKRCGQHEQRDRTEVWQRCFVAMPVWAHVHARHLATHVRLSQILYCCYARRQKDRSASVHPPLHWLMVELHSQKNSKLLILARADYLKRLVKQSPNYFFKKLDMFLSNKLLHNPTVWQCFCLFFVTPGKTGPRYNHWFSVIYRNMSLCPHIHNAWCWMVQWFIQHIKIWQQGC
jgi:hypothetical protein